jgi:hypothetical protein
MTDAGFTDFVTSMAALSSAVGQSLSQLVTACTVWRLLGGLLWGLLLKGQAPTLKTSPLHIQGSKVLLGFVFVAWTMHFQSYNGLKPTKCINGQYI